MLPDLASIYVAGGSDAALGLEFWQVCGMDCDFVLQSGGIH